MNMDVRNNYGLNTTIMNDKEISGSMPGHLLYYTMGK